MCIWSAVLLFLFLLMYGFPAVKKVKPQVAHQFAVGYFQNFLQDQYEGSIELYYKKMSNQIDYREGANFLFQDNIETELVFGNGWSYGAEFYLRKRAGRLTGWLGYTLSWTWRKFEDLNFGRPYHAKYDRRHDLSWFWFISLMKTGPFLLFSFMAAGTGSRVLQERYLSLRLVGLIIIPGLMILPPEMTTVSSLIIVWILDSGMRRKRPNIPAHGI